MTIITITKPNPLDGCEDFYIQENDIMEDLSKSSALFILNIIENYLKERIKNGDKIEDLTQRQEQDGTLNIFLKLQRIATFKFESLIVEGNNKNYQHTINVTRQDY